jgi:UDP-N-acetylmuramate dehydrogenase
MDIIDTEFLEQVENLFAKEDIRENEPMSRHTTFRVGGPARIFLTVHDDGQLAELLGLLKGRQLPYFILGNGSNLLVADRGFDGVVIALGEEYARIEVQENRIRAGAAAMLGKVAKAAMEQGLSGLEFAAGIPGSLGGGVVMNAGAYGGELSQVVTRVKAMDEQGNIVCLENKDLQMGYRTSIFKQKNYLILQATMELTPSRTESVAEKMKEYNRQRQEKQPLEYPSAGSTFKRPKGYYAGKLIMEAGLRGFSVGGAQVSEKHCGFIINKGQATAADIHGLIDEVTRKVEENSGVKLEPEVIFLGED